MFPQYIFLKSSWWFLIILFYRKHMFSIKKSLRRPTNVMFPWPTRVTTLTWYILDQANMNPFKATTRNKAVSVSRFFYRGQLKNLCASYFFVFFLGIETIDTASQFNSHSEILPSTPYLQLKYYPFIKLCTLNNLLL